MNAFDVARLRYLQLQMLLTVESSEMRTHHKCVGSDTRYGANNSPAFSAALNHVEQLFLRLPKQPSNLHPANTALKPGWSQ